MQIAIITPTFSSVGGGIGKAAQDEARELQKFGHKITVFTPNYNRHKSNFIESSGFELIRLRPALKYGNAALVPQLLWKLRGFDAVYLHYPFFGGAEFVALAKFLGIGHWDLVSRYHMDVCGRGFIKKIFSFHTKFIMPRILKMADKIVVSTFDYAKHSNIAGVLERQPDKFIEAPFGIKIKNARLPFLSKSVAVKSVLFVGGLDKAHYFKGVPVLLEAFKKCLVRHDFDLRLIMVGDGDLRLEYENLAKGLGIRDRVDFIGFTPNEKLSEYYENADLFVLPSIDSSEAFGLVLLEAMAYGLPVVASNLPGVRTLVQENGFLAEPKNPDDLAQKMLKILSDETLAKEMGERGRKMVEEKYASEKIGEQLNEVFSSFC